MGLTSKLAVSVTTEHTKAFDLTTNASVKLSKIYQAVLASGTAVGQADLVFHDQRMLTASSSEDLDLAGVLSDAFGASLTYIRVKGLIIAALGVTNADGVVTTPNTNNVVVGAASSNAWAALLNATGTVTLRPGAIAAFIAGATDATGYAVTGGTGDLLKVANSAGGSSVTYDIIVIGASA